MAKTNLDYVQSILNDMDSDEVNSVNDTTEALQVLQIVGDSYQAMMSNRNWPHMRQSIKIESSGDITRPTHLNLQDNIKEISFINYDKVKDGETRKVYRAVKWREPDEFLRILNNRNTDDPSISVIQDGSGVELLIKNNKAPDYYTTFNDDEIIFDSYDNSIETAIKQSKIQSMGYVFPLWEPSDTFIPKLPMEAETALLEEAKSRAMFKLKQTNDIKSEQEAQRQNRWLARKAWRVSGGIKYEDYGRKPRK